MGEAKTDLEDMDKLLYNIKVILKTFFYAIYVRDFKFSYNDPTKLSAENYLKVYFTQV